jgi:hypothetical protein
MVENFLSWTPRNRDLLSLPMLDTLLSFLSRSLSVTRQAVFCSLLTLLLPNLMQFECARNTSACRPRTKPLVAPDCLETVQSCRPSQSTTHDNEKPRRQPHHIGTSLTLYKVEHHQIPRGEHKDPSTLPPTLFLILSYLEIPQQEVESNVYLTKSE